MRSIQHTDNHTHTYHRYITYMDRQKRSSHYDYSSVVARFLSTPLVWPRAYVSTASHNCHETNLITFTWSSGCSIMTTGLVLLSPWLVTNYGEYNNAQCKALPICTMSTWHFNAYTVAEYRSEETTRQHSTLQTWMYCAVVWQHSTDYIPILQITYLSWPSRGSQCFFLNSAHLRVRCDVVWATLKGRL